MDRIAFVVPFGFPTNTNNEKMNSQENDEEEYFVINDGVIEMDEEDNQNNTKKPEPQPAPGKLEALPIIIRFGGGEMEKVGHIAPLDPLYGLPNHGFLSGKESDDVLLFFVFLFFVFLFFVFCFLLFFVFLFFFCFFLFFCFFVFLFFCFFVFLFFCFFVFFLFLFLFLFLFFSHPSFQRSEEFYKKKEFQRFFFCLF